MNGERKLSIVHVEFLHNASGIFHNMVVVFLRILECLDLVSNSHIFKHLPANPIHAQISNRKQSNSAR